MIKMIKSLSILIVFSASTAYAGGNNDHEAVLAVVSSELILVSDFTETYTGILQKFGLNDSKKLRSETLDKLIRDKVIYDYAIRSGLHLTGESQHELEKIKIQALLNAYVSNKLAPSVKVDENDLLETYRRMNTKLKLRQVYSADKTGADSLYNLLCEGADFETLAINSHKNKVLKQKAGLLGYVGFDELHPALENEVYKLEPGEFTRPVKTAYGYSIVRVEDIAANPVLTENDFNNKKNDLINITRKKKQEILFQKYIEKVVGDLNVKYNNDVLNELWNHIYAETNHNSEFQTVIPESGRVLLHTTDSRLTVADFIEKAKYTSVNQQNLIKTRQGLIDFINGLVARDIILREAKEMDLASTLDYKKEVSRDYEAFLIQKAEETLRSAINVTEDNAYSYYSKNIHLYTIPGKIEIYGILLNDSHIHSQVLQQLNEGVPFEALAEKYSIQRETAAGGGRMGYFTREELGWAGEEIFNLEPGQFEGNLHMDGKYLIVRCSDKTPATVIEFDNVKESIISELQQYSLKDVIENLVTDKKNKSELIINTEVLNSIIITHSK